jgi:hypothetical protein
MEIPRGLQWIKDTPEYNDYKDDIELLLAKLSNRFIDSVNAYRENLNKEGIYRKKDVAPSSVELSKTDKCDVQQ